MINTLDGGDRLFSRRLGCPECGLSVPEMSPRAFSFNSPHGACQECQGLGAIYDFDPRRVVPDDTVSLSSGAVVPWGTGDDGSRAEMLAGLERAFGIDASAPFRPAAEEASRPRPVWRAEPAHRRHGKGSRSNPFGVDFEGAIPNLRRRFETGAWTDQEALERFRALQPCRACRGDRLRPESRAVRVKGRRMADYVGLPLADVAAGLRDLRPVGARAPDRGPGAARKFATGSAF